jgi:AraC-like DNA-binding protein
MQIASSLLEKGTRVTVTANSVGYTDMFTFSKAFKSYYGLSPSEYAKSIAY